MENTREYRMKFAQRAQEILRTLTLEEKVSLMGGNATVEDLMDLVENMSDDNHYNIMPFEAGGIAEKGIPAMKFVDGPRGVVCGNRQTTCFPVSMARGATFDTELEEKIGEAIGEEVKVFGGNTYAGVCVNLPYHPGWGRSQETYGEESFHIGQMGSALVRGVQSKEVVACVKHFAFNQMECSRFKVNVDCDKRTEKEVFLPHFKDCIDAGAGSVMSSYNLYKGVHCGHSNYLLNEVLKKEWQFDGFVMSDFEWGILDTVEAANGGQDMEMSITQFFGEKLVKAVEDGFVPEERIDDAVLRILRTLLSVKADQPEAVCKEKAGTKEHIALAKQCARESITLIQNRENVLPFEKEKVKKVVVIGMLADMENTGDHGSSQVRPAYVVTPLQGILKAVPDADVEWLDGSDVNAAKEKAAKADAVIFVAGYNYNDEGEFISEDMNNNYTGGIGGDRKHGLDLHEDEIELIREVGPCNRNSAVVLIGGNTIMIEKWKADVSAILMAYYPGQEGGTAIGEILFGDVNPSGKLPFVIPQSEKDLPSVSWDTTSQWYEYYHGYTRLEKNKRRPAVPYGFGLSYTQFAYESVQCEADEENLYVKGVVKNIGSRKGTDVAQFYAGYENSQIDRPVKILRGFTRVTLEPGEEKTVEIICPIEKLKWYDPVEKEWKLEHMKYNIYLGNSSAGEDLIKTSIRL